MSAMARVREAFAAIEVVERPEVWIALRDEGAALADAMAVDQRLAAGPPVAGSAKSHDHRHAAGAREHRDVAGRAALGQHNGAAFLPVDAEKARERQVGRDHHRAAGNRRAISRRRQMPEHAVADVLEIGCASGEVGILSGAITGDFDRHRGLPRCARRLAG